ncbi:periplasmic heavy metal sensor [Kaistia dalseonensis]|uniref:Membrane protein n=1 Tax=Kaistia dalseonensis TaxID=410840 RepID=A0ABU0HAK4_9HYPH|nr:periplasmic heavy metal sensor [Kaistia dalseonensis]MCX5495936.1 periplasmic heavy metal sensor [Kaistia dalseonensis]MDQ0438539.1 putative membrane protein [Kaistia dalseonensis]
MNVSGLAFSGRSALALVAVLAVSLLLNFVGIGYIASGFVGQRDRPVGAERLVTLGARSLPPDLRRGITAALDQRKDDLRSASRGVRDARLALFAAMRAEPFNADAVRAAFADLRGKLAATSEIGQDAIVDALEKATPETRAAIEPPGRRR